MSTLTPELTNPVVRRALTRDDPMGFALLYLRHHLTAPDGTISFAECHYQWCEIAKTWIGDRYQWHGNRHAFLAPRATGKSTWWLLILPMWAAAHGHAQFASFFADTYAQAQQHAATFRRELETNVFLRNDFPDLCTPGRTPTGMNESNTKDLTIRQSGFVLTAKGMDSGALGMKVGERRPDLLLLDDIEPDEANYSTYLAEKRRGTLIDAILPLNEYAKVVLSGTVTMPGSVTHQLVKWGRGARDEENAWIGQQHFDVHHALPILDNGDGTRRSQWPTKWKLADLEAIEHTRAYRKNYANDPMAVDSDYWTSDDFTYGTFDVSKTILSIDGAVTANKTSDFTGLAVVSWTGSGGGATGRCLVEHVEQVRLKGIPLRERVLRLVESFPHISLILVEANQGGELWRELLRDMPCRMKTMTVSAKKEVRAGKLLAEYQKVPPRVVHARPFAALEEQMVAFPKALHDDMIDAVGNGVTHLLRGPASIGTPGYMRR